MATIAFADMYGANPPGRKAGDVAPAPEAVASGSYAPAPAKAPALFWVGMIAALAAIRVLWEVAS